MYKEGDVITIHGGRQAVVLKRKRGGRLVAALKSRRRKKGEGGEVVETVSGIVLLRPKVTYEVETWL